jgi:hypothetical protein
VTALPPEQGTGLLLVAALRATGDPQTLVFVGTNPTTGKSWGHAVVAYAYDAAAGRFLVYDNNFPGEVVTLAWSPLGGFGAYSKAAAYPSAPSGFGFESFSSVMSAADYASFYLGAENGWTSSDYNTITIEAPAPDASGTATVGSEDPVEVLGTVSQGLRPAKYVGYFLNGGKMNREAVRADGSFLLPIPLSELATGTNTLWLVATDDAQSWFGAYAGFAEVRLRLGTFFVNLGFETGDFTGWDHETHTWHAATPGSYVPEKSAVVGASSDAIAGSLATVNVGSHAARVNNADDSWHISTVSQAATVPTGQTTELRFYWAAVLEDPDHDPADQPYLDIRVVDEASGATLYQRHFYANDPSYSGWQSFQGGSWKAIPWQVAIVDLSGAAGHDVRIVVTAADCALGGHGGYVYLDGDE